MKKKQNFIQRLCGKLQKLNPDFKNHWCFTRQGDEKIKIRCRDEVSFFNSEITSSSSRKIKIITPLWEVENILRFAEKIGLEMHIICCRLLVKNVGQPTDENHKVAPCEKCGQPCIERPELEAEALKIYPDAKAWCTECAVKEGIKK